MSIIVDILRYLCGLEYTFERLTWLTLSGYSADNSNKKFHIFSFLVLVSELYVVTSPSLISFIPNLSVKSRHLGATLFPSWALEK